MISSKRFQKSRAHLQAQITKDHFKEVKEIIMGSRDSSGERFGKEQSFEDDFVKPIAKSCVDANKIKLKSSSMRKASM